MRPTQKCCYNKNYFRTQKSNNAFTLAEVLIVLAIIGIVAALTIPALMNNIQDQQYKASWKKLYSDISNAAKALSLDYPDMSSELSVAQAFCNQLKCIKICDTEQSISGGCWKSGTKILGKDGSYITDNIGDYGAGAACIVLVNGDIICFDEGHINGKLYASMYFDVNGIAPPNIVGKDVFGGIFSTDLFLFKPAVGLNTDWGTADGYFMTPTSGDGTCDGPTADSKGWGCSSYYLKN